MNNDNNNQKGGLQVEIDKETATGTYSNLAMIKHSNSEFIVDFIQMMPGMPKARVNSRIILTPQHAKRLMNALRANVQKYENQFGEIKDQTPDSDVATPFPTNFGQMGEA